MSYKIVIPARLHSTRLPKKLLRDAAGLPLIMHTLNNALGSQAEQIIVAVDHADLQTTIEKYAADVIKTGRVSVVMTADSHESGTSRLSEVAKKYNFSDDEVIINVQGDEPALPIQIADNLAKSLKASHQASVVTPVVPITDPVALFNPNIVKVVFDQNYRALYFSRAPIPYQRDWQMPLDTKSNISLQPGLYWRHLGLYGYKGQFLKQFDTVPSASYETTERLEQLSFLVAGHQIQIYPLDIAPPVGIDTADDLAEFIKKR